MGKEIRTSIDSYKKLKATYDECIGDTIVFNSDTLMIIDYSLWNETFKLSNHMEVNYKLVLNKEENE